MRFWCSTLEAPWSWKFRAYPGIWLAVAALFVPYLMAQARRAGPNPDRKRHTTFYLAGVLAFWVATDWPLGLLGASYLAWAHMVQFLLYTIVAAPLILLGTPEWMARQVVGKLRIYRSTLRLSRPVMAGVVFNLLLVATHAPWSVDTLRSSQFGSFAMDVVWLVMGLLVWLPIVSPLPEHRMTSYPAKMAYMFLALGVVPAVPAGFLTFASFPLYATYELAPRVHGMAAATDQQLAGLVMKLGGIPIIWGAILVMLGRWAAEDRSNSEATREGMDRAPAG
ncbi:MAG: cytochrome c oxidase assembly protein [Actinomycetota bacterium]|nr:cytochrome c oxidase assembly protein [Actinomycetota bacterium]